MSRKSRKIFWQALSASAGFIVASAPCQADDTLSLALASGNETKVVRVGIEREWDRSQAQRGGFHAVGYWDASLALWRELQYRGVPNATKNIADIGIAGIFRLVSENKMGPYADAGLGVHLLSTHYNNNGRQLSTNFEFGTQLGVGYIFSNKFDIGLQAEHFSNGGRRQPNSGANFLVFRIARSL